ncbi:MAG: hypothetical protein C0600_03730 [Ignavibacteria bacterium]|nr:MAG: hypothetical protein C0600_03730 [Ignavibacteria bacterium]
MNVLIAEDNSNMRKLLRQLLSGTGTTIREAMDGREAVQLYASVQPDFVVMDIAMPVLSGIEAMRRIISAWPEARIIIVTVMDDCAHRRAAERAGAFAFFGKEDLMHMQDYLLGTILSLRGKPLPLQPRCA